MGNVVEVNTALISVSDKTGLVAFAQGLAQAGVKLLSTGGSAQTMRDAGLEVEDVSEYTGMPEMMGGRIKTLHPKVHGGLLARAGEDDEALKKLSAGLIDLVVVNLYPFEATVKRGARYEEVIENIDIGGPAMLRSAAKNHARVSVVVDPSDYTPVLDRIKEARGLTLDMRVRLAHKAFAHTARYDAAITGYFDQHLHGDNKAQVSFPSAQMISLEKAYDLRYGENPHQNAAFYRTSTATTLDGSLGGARSVGEGAKELSYNNLLDAHAALGAVKEFSIDVPAAVIIKHNNPCGVSTGRSLLEAYKAARDADPVSVFGGIVALNQEVDVATAEALAETFLECIVAPVFSSLALQRLRTKKNLRLVEVGRWSAGKAELEWRSVSGGCLIQTSDVAREDELVVAQTVTQRKPTDSERLALDFAWRVCKHVKSNAIVLATGETYCSTVGVGAGQMSRVESVEIAVRKAAEKAKGAVLASDAFFPFADGLELAARAGISAVVQPGGSVRDEEVIACANKYNIAMIFSGIRHFRH